MKEYGWGDTVKFEEEAETTKGSESVQIQVDAKELYAKNNILAAAPKERKYEDCRHESRCACQMHKARVELLW